MKIFLLVIILNSLFYTLNSFAQSYGWIDLSDNMPEQGNLNDVHVIGEEVWITGGNDKVYYTPDGGESFQIQQLPENSGLSSSIFMKTNQEGYVVTFLGNILKTTDGGIIWNTLHEPGGGLNSVHFPPSSNTGYTCGSNGTVWQFDDVSITDISPSGVSTNLQSICFPVNNNDGKVCGETTIARYKNNTWANLQYWDSTIFYNSIFFIDDTTGWCVGIAGTIILVEDGISWVAQASNTTITLNDVFFINSLEGWAVGYENLLHSVDGGVTWTQELESFSLGKILRAVYFTSPNSGYVVGNYTVLKYGEITSVEKDEELPTEFSLSQNYPNPFNPSTTIKYEIPNVEKGHAPSVRLAVYDVLGREVAVLVDEQQHPGNYEVSFDASKLSSGVFYYQLRSGSFLETKKMIFMK